MNSKPREALSPATRLCATHSTFTLSSFTSRAYLSESSRTWLAYCSACPVSEIANVMARVSGVSVERGNTGDGQYVIIRGMDPRYSTTLIDGVKSPSPDNAERYVPLDIFPADLEERIEVYKSLTPDMEGDASGGVVNMVMKTAPDRLRIDGYFGTGYIGNLYIT